MSNLEYFAALIGILCQIPILVHPETMNDSEKKKLTLQTSLGEAVGLVWVDTVHIGGFEILIYPSAP